MTARLMVTAAVMLSLSAFARAAAPTAAPADKNHAPSCQADIVLASAETAHAPDQAEAERTAPPVRKRVARVTTCRCGDTVPAETPDE